MSGKDYKGVWSRRRVIVTILRESKQVVVFLQCWSLVWIISVRDLTQRAGFGKIYVLSALIGDTAEGVLAPSVTTFSEDIKFYWSPKENCPVGGK